MAVIDSREYISRNKITLEDYNDLLIELEEYIKEFLEEKDIDKKHFTSMQWAACLMYLYRHTFRVNPKYLFRTDRVSKDIYNYDLFKVNKVLDIYLYLCYVYSFRICIEHFCFFTGIKPTTVYNWRYNSKTLYIDSDSDLIITRVNISSVDMYSNNNIYSNTDNSDIDRDNIDISSIDSSSNIYNNSDTNIHDINIDNVNTYDVYSNSDANSSNINMDPVNISSNINSGMIDNIVVTIKPMDIYNRLVSNTVSAADDLMLSKHGVNSIAYRNMIQERYNSRIQDAIPVLEMGSLADQLGISKELASLPDKELE